MGKSAREAVSINLHICGNEKVKIHNLGNLMKTIMHPVRL